MADEIKFDEAQQKLVDKLVGEARVKARETAQAEFTDKSVKEQEAAEQAALVAGKKWQELAQKHETRAKELEPFEAEAKAYREMVTGMLKDRVKELGEDAKKAVAALPDSLTDLDKLNWLNQNTKLFEAVGDGVGTPGRPQPKPGKQERAGPISKFPIKL